MPAAVAASATATAEVSREIPAAEEPEEAPYIDLEAVASDNSTPIPTLEEAVESIPESTRSLLEKRLRGRFIGVTRLPRNALIK